MSVMLKALELELNGLLKPEQFDDYCPNGLQVQGTDTIKKVVTGVTACQALLDEAVRLNADLVLVHHGYFWRGEDQSITGIKRERIKTLLDHGISLMAYHLPLDVHPEFGNNAQFGKLLDLRVTGNLGQLGNHAIGLIGEADKPYSVDEFGCLLEDRLNRAPLVIKSNSNKICRVAWCTGAAQHFMVDAVRAGVDAYISGEVSEQTVHIARETSIHFFAAGHHASERYGVQALGTYLADKYSLEHMFVDIHNPV